jgi:rubrerythrin
MMLALLVAAPAFGGAAQRERRGEATTRPGGTSRALRAALDVERQSQAYYLAVLQKHRPIHPFGMVYRMERQHEQALLDELEARGITPPQDRWQNEPIAAPQTRDEALAKAIEMEKQTVAAYDRAIVVTKNAALKTTLERLRTESVDHQKWFEDPSTCPGPGGGQGPGGGRGPGGPGGAGGGRGRA